MATCVKCGAPRVSEGELCGCRADRPQLKLVQRRKPAATTAGELRPFLIAGLVFLFLLVGTRFAVGYYAAAQSNALQKHDLPFLTQLHLTQ
jgi:hypothetical protein